MKLLKRWVRASSRLFNESRSDQQTSKHHRGSRRRLLIESLESRRLLAAFTPGNLAIYRVGGGTEGPLANTGNTVFIDEYSPSGTLVQSIHLPNSGASTSLVANGFLLRRSFESVGRRKLLAPCRLWPDRDSNCDQHSGEPRCRRQPCFRAH